jgi:hypothetical protein
MAARAVSECPPAQQKIPASRYPIPSAYAQDRAGSAGGAPSAGVKTLSSLVSSHRIACDDVKGGAVARGQWTNPSRPAAPVAVWPCLRRRAPTPRPRPRGDARTSTTSTWIYAYGVRSRVGEPESGRSCYVTYIRYASSRLYVCYLLRASSLATYSCR